MATILPFKPTRLRVRSQLPASSGGAAIVIFPGVRYERGSCAGVHGKAETEVRRKLKLRNKR